MELVNTHCHSHYCGHGEGEIEDYASAAEQAWLSLLAFTEHYPLTYAFDPEGNLSVPADQMPRYLEDVERARASHPSLEIITGCEMDYLGEDEDRVITDEDLKPFSLILRSVHFVDRWAFDDPDKRDHWDDEGAPDAIWQRYFDLWCQAATDESQRFDVMSHPDLAKKFNYYPTYDLTSFYERAAEAVASSGRMVEVNTSGAHYACKEMFPAPELLACFCRAGVPCTVGTDAHLPQNVSRDINNAYGYMYDAGYRFVTVPTSSGDRREIPLE